MRLADKRVLVIGASSGIGLASAQAIVAEGARVAFAARRMDRLEKAVEESGAGHLALSCDVRDENSCQATVDAAVDAFGGLDAIVYTPGISTFGPIEDTNAESWRAVLDTNLVGATLATKAAIAHLSKVRGKVVFVSSIVIDDAPPRPEQSTYVVSKIALEALAKAWQGEHRRVGFTTIAMGDTLTEFGQDHDMSVLAGIVERWVAGGYLYGRMMEASEIAAQVVNALASPETIRRIAITPRYPDEDPDDGRDWGLAELEHARGKNGD